MRRTATILFFLIACMRIIFPIFKNRHLFTESFNPELYEKKYNASQYMIPQSKNPISDEVLLSHAGYQYIKGINPILINSDHPPLGKYIIGFFILVFNNNRIVSIFFAVFNVVLLCTIIYYVAHSKLLTSLGALFLSLDPMLIDQIIHSPILDIIQVSFLLLYILLVVWFIKTKRKIIFIPMAVTLGLLSSIKLYFPALVMIGVTAISFFMFRKKVYIILYYLFVTIPLAFFTYALTYLRYFQYAKGIFPFFGVQKWIYLFWQNNSIDRTKVFANVIPLILVNRWKIWWGTIPYISYSGWSITWPIFFVLSLTSSIFFVYHFIFPKSKKNIQNPFMQINLFLSLWFLLFFCYLCFIPISPRYLMMLFFPSYILVVFSILYAVQYYILPYEKNKKYKK